MAFASSFDGFVVGITYYIKGLGINRVHYLTMGLCTGTMMAFSMAVGKLLASVLPSNLETYFGAVILIGLGGWQIRHQIQPNTPHDKDFSAFATGSSPSNNCMYRVARTITTILKEPLKADQDLSGTIDGKEAWLLSVALGMDAFAAGLGVSSMGFSLLLIPISALFSPLFVFLGFTVAKITLPKSRGPKDKQVLPGLLLMLIGLLKILGWF